MTEMFKGGRPLGIIFPNMRDELIGELTSLRTAGSVPFGGRYRLIDFALSEMVAAGVQEVGIAVKRNYTSLMDHLGSGKEYDLARKRGGLKIFPPFAEAGTESYSGKIQALNNLMGFIAGSSAQTVIMADGDIVSAIDYSDVLAQHAATKAQITAVYKKEVIDAGSKTDNVTFDIDSDKKIRAVYVCEEVGKEANCGMWAYVIDKQLLMELVKESIRKGERDFERDILQRKTGSIRMYGYEYKFYLKRITSLKNYFEANLDLLNEDSRNRLFGTHPIYTKVRDDAPIRYKIGSSVKNVLAADGCYIEGQVSDSVLFRGVKIGKGANVSNCVIMQDSVIGDGVILKNVICDKNTVITKEKVLIGDTNHPVFVPKHEIV